MRRRPPTGENSHARSVSPSAPASLRPPAEIVAGFADGNLTLMLPSRRQITYPQARLVPSNKFEDGDPDVLFKDNAHGKWTDYRGWFGTFVENAVQGTARDLLAAAIERFEARGIEIVLTVHDEVVAEVPTGSISEADFLSILLEAPAWADGLPLAGKVWSGSHYLEPPEEPNAGIRQSNDPEAPREAEFEAELDAAIARIDAIPAEHVKAATTVFEDDVPGDDMPPLFDLVSVPLTADHKTSCPFHPDDDTAVAPILRRPLLLLRLWRSWQPRGLAGAGRRHVARGGHRLHPRLGRPGAPQRPAEDPEASSRARSICGRKARPIAGTIAERYLAETRRIDVAGLPANISDSLRFHRPLPVRTGAL